MKNNAVSIEIVPSNPMTIAVLAKDNADPKTGMAVSEKHGKADHEMRSISWRKLIEQFLRGAVSRFRMSPRQERRSDRPREPLSTAAVKWTEASSQLSSPRRSISPEQVRDRGFAAPANWTEAP
jgi:hypothetical protein